MLLFTASIVFLGVFTFLFSYLATLRLESFANIQPDDNAYFRQYFSIIIGTFHNFSIAPSGIPAPHFSPIIYLLAPLYKIFPYLRTLFVLQSFIILTGIYPVYAIMRLFKNAKSISIITALFYVFNPFTIELLLNDFRFMSISLTFIMATYYFFLRKKMILFIIFSLLTLSCREELVIIFPFLCLLNLNKNMKISKAYAIASIALPVFWYLGVFTVFYNPGNSFSPSPVHPSPYITLWQIFNWKPHYLFIKESLLIISTNLSNPKILFSLFMLYRPKIIIPLYAIGILTSTYGNMFSHMESVFFSPQAHYNTIPLAFVFLTFMFFITNIQLNYKLFIANGFLYLSFFYFLVAASSNIHYAPIKKTEKKILTNYLSEILQTKNKSSIILSDALFTPMLADRPHVFLPYSIAPKYPSLSRMMQHVSYILIKKNRLSSKLKNTLLTQKAKITETDNYYLIHYLSAFDIEPYLINKNEIIYLYPEEN